jgi:hypothetical protein
MSGLGDRPWFGISWRGRKEPPFPRAEVAILPSAATLTGARLQLVRSRYNLANVSKRGWCVGPQFARVFHVLGVSRSSFHHMTAHKKSTSKASKSPTPATKSTKATKAKPTAAAAPAPAPATPAPVAPRPVAAVETKPAAAVTASAPAVATVSAVAVAPAARAVAAVASKPVVTTITARINVGFGNALYLRGDGAGLSWNRGVQMTCMSANEWLITIPESARPVLFKFLINDLTWSSGPDYSVIPGTSTVLSPTFA